MRTEESPVIFDYCNVPECAIIRDAANILLHRFVRSDVTLPMVLASLHVRCVRRTDKSVMTFNYPNERCIRNDLKLFVDLITDRPKRRPAIPRRVSADPIDIMTGR